MAFFFGFREDHTVLMPHPEPSGRKHMNITRRLKSFTALALSLCMGLQFYPVLGEETTEPVTTDLSTSTSVDWTLNTYTARNDGTAFSLGLSFEEGTVLHAGDTMSLALPEGYSFSDITEALPLYVVRNGVPGELLGSYTISGNVLSLVFNEVTDLTGVTTEITVTGTETQPVTEGYYKEQTWTMEQDEDGTVNTVTFTVPSSDIMNWTWVSEDGTWTSTVDSIQKTAGGTTTLVLSNAMTNTASYTFTLPEGIKAADGNAELSYAPTNPDGTQSQSISIGTYSVTENTLTANVTTIPTEAVTVSLPFTWSTEPLPTATPEIVDEELIDAITEENEKLNETPAPTTSPVTTATPETTETPEVTPTPEATETPTPEPTETPAANNEINMMAEGRAKPGDKVNYTAWTPSIAYNGVSNTQDIYWIDNSNGEETRPTIDAFKELLNTENNDKLTLTGVQNDGTEVTLYGKSISLTVDGEQVVVPLETWKMNITDLGGTGHWNFNINDLPSQITLTRNFDEVTGVDENNNPTSYTERTETVTITLSDWQIDPTVTSIDEQGNQTTESIDPIPGTDTSTGYSFVNVFDDPDTTDVDYVDQTGRPRPGAASLGEGWYFVQETDYEFNIILRRGDNILIDTTKDGEGNIIPDPDQVKILVDAFRSKYSFYYDNLRTGTGAVKGNFRLNDPTADQFIDFDQQVGFGIEDQFPVATYTLAGLEKYNLDGSEIMFYIDQNPSIYNEEGVVTGENPDTNKSDIISYTDLNGLNIDDGDYLKEEIENDAVSNHGTDVEKVYSGGTLYLTLAGETNYVGHKEWHDQYAIEQGWNRPDVTFTLWRFTQKPGMDLSTAYQSASPVQATGGRAVGSGTTPTNAMQTASETILSHIAEGGDKSNYEVTFIENFVAEGTSEEDYPTKYLPKYDAEGYTYVYFARETMSGEHADDYRTEFGKLIDDPNSFNGRFEDTLPGDTETEKATRHEHDNSIYNGGTISNVINGTTTTEVRKTWIADAFQSELGDVTVQFKLQARAAGEEKWIDVPDRIFRMGHTDKSIEAIKDDGTGGQGVPFVAENLMQTHSINMPQYDNHGNELEYRWVEDKIFQDGVEVKRNDKGGFTLSQNGETVSYTSTTINPLDDSTLTDIVNEIVDVTEYNVDKFWSEELKDYFNDPENNFDQDTINRVNSGTYWPVSLKMYRSNSKNVSEELLLLDGNRNITPDKYFQLDGNIDEEATPLYAPNPEFDKTIADTGDIEGNNPKYVYAGEVKETEKWHAEYINLDLYDEGGSPFDYIVLEAYEDGVFWSADYSVTVDEESGITTFVITNGPPPGDSDRIYVRKRWLDDGDEQHRGNVTMTAYRINDNADVNNLKWTDLTPLNSTVLNRENNWWDSITIASNVEENGIVQPDRLIVLETSIAGVQDSETDNDLTGYYKNDTTGLLTKIYNDQHDIEDNNNSYFQYQTSHHDYEATFSMVNLEDVNFYTVTNRRLGRVDITVTKQWLDGNNDKKVRNEFINEIKELGYELVLQLVPAERQDFDVDAPVIDYANNSIQLVNETQKIKKPVDTVNQTKDNLVDSEAIQVIDTANANSIYYFWDLPKYNEYGKIVRYDVIEGVREKGGSSNTVIPIAQFVSEHSIDTEYTFGHVQNSYTTSSDITPDDQVITVTNRLSGTKQVYFWKEWNDAYRYKMEPATQRPDIYLGLYRYNKGTQELTSLYSDIEWTFYDDEYISLSDFGYMDKYDAQGNEYIYYAREYVKMEDKTQFDYKDVYYKYDQDLEDPTLTDTFVNETLNGQTSIGNETSVAVNPNNQEWVDQYGNELMMYEPNSKIYLLKEYGAFVNDIEANVEISGQKIWANVPVGFEDEDLIPVTFYVFQYTNGVDDDIPILSGEGAPSMTDKDGNPFNSVNSGNDDYLPYLNGKQAYAWVTINDWELQKYKGTYSFSIDYVGKNTNDVIQAVEEIEEYKDDEFVIKKYTNKDGKLELSEGDIVVKPGATVSGAIPADSAYLPKYDDEGNLYTYVLRESGYFGNSDAGEDDTKGDGRGFVFTQPIMNDFAITNAYTPVKGDINVRKILDISDFENLDELGEIPAVTFTLTRSYKSTDTFDAAGNLAMIKEEFSREITLNANGFTKVDGQDNVYVQEGKFEDLEIYAPNGNKYVYTITENSKLDNGSHLIQGGYEAYGANGWHELEVSQHLYPDRGDLNAYSISGLYPKYVEKTDNPVTAVINGIGDFFTGIGEFLGITKQENPTGDDTSWATFKNVYNKEEAPVEFGKIWEDNGQSNGRFTTPLTFEVRQWADAQPGQNNAINTKDTLMGTFTIALKEAADGQLSVKDQSSVTLTREDSIYGSITVNTDKNQNKAENVLNYIKSVTVYVDNPDPDNPQITQTLGNNNNWKIKVEGFQTYAPNGMPWRYQLKEVDVYPYIITNETMEFRYDGTTFTFVRTNGSEVLTNTSRITVTATKNITTAAEPDGNYADNSQTVWNYTGFDVRVNFDLYATFVQANSWDDAMNKILAEPTNGAQTNTTWVNLRTNEKAEYRDKLIEAMKAEDAPNKDYTQTFTASTTFKKNESFGKQSASYGNLPKVLDSDNGTVYVTYILMETSIELLDGKDANGKDIVVYREELTPNFVRTTVPDGVKYNGDYKVGDEVIAYYFESPTAQLLNTTNNALEDTSYIFMNPVFDSKEDVTGVDKDGQKYEESQIYHFNFQSFEEWLPYVWIGKYDENNPRQATYINDEFNTFEATNVNVTKEWDENDHNNIYGTRPDPDGDDNWEVDYQLEVKIKDGTQPDEEDIWVPLPLGSNKYKVITGGDNDNLVTVNYTNLPASGIYKYTYTVIDEDQNEKEVTEYIAVSFDSMEYRVREKNTVDNKLLDENGTYNQAYKVTYYNSTKLPIEDPETYSKINPTMHNQLVTIDVNAQKKWEDWGIIDGSTKLTSTITFELQYQSGWKKNDDGTFAHDEDGNKIPIWKSFDTPAIVELDGTQATEEEKKVKPYYEDKEWHAVWKDVPQVMPGSETEPIGEGENAPQRTIYRVIEVSDENNVYGRYVKDSIVLLPGSGTEGDEYILKDVTADTDTDLSFEITNALTVFELRKTVSKPSGASLTEKSNEVFTFTISPPNNLKIPDSAKYQKYASDQQTIGELTKFEGTVTLKDGEYVMIFGLQKGVEYTVTESVADKNFSYAITYTLNELDSNGNENSSPKNTVKLLDKELDAKKFKIPTMEVTNTVLGSVSITKEDINGNEVDGVIFELEYLSDPATTNSWLPAEYWENGAWVKPDSEKGNIEESKNGKVFFSNLRVFDDDLNPIQYRLTEVSAPGYHKYPEPIKFRLPYEAQDEEQGNAAFYTKDVDGKTVYFYPEIKLTIKNDHAFIMPQTSGTGFFWPGMIGVAVSVLSAGGYVVTRKKKKREEENEEVN